MSHEPHLRPYHNILETIGWTPLVRLRRVVDGARTPVFAKVESFNPGGSVKDRIGIAIIEAAEREGRLNPGGTVVEGTSGNTGVGLAIAAAVKGYRCIFTIPDKMSTEKVRLLKGFGAEVIVTPTAVPPDHPDYYVNVAKRIVAERSNTILADQFYNPVNPQAHYETTGPEIWKQTGGRVTHFVAAPGTGGTISGVGRYLKEQNPDIRVIAGDPDGSILAEYARTGESGEGTPYKVEGIGNDKIPSTLHFDVIDEFRTVGDREAFLMARRVTREEGLFVGGSTGLIVRLAVDVARETDDPDGCIVCLVCDTGERYLSKVYNDAWMQENRMLLAERADAAGLLAAKEGGTASLVSVAPGAKVRDALALLEEHNLSQLPVLEQGTCVGAVTESTLLSAVLETPECLDAPVSELAGDPFPSVASEASLAEISRALSRKAPAVLVRSDGAIVGILTRHDLLHRLIER
ncbi:MAG: pyridoxal-phosphate dependent enzyme [Gemmatimonadota bacterium]